MSRTENYINNSAAMALQQVVVLAAGFIAPRYFLTAYGSEINGLIVSVSQFISYFSLVEAGISGAAICALYKPLADRNIPAINGLLSASHRFYTKSGYAFIALVSLLALLYPFIARNLLLSHAQVGVIVFCLGASGAMDFFTLSKYRVLLTADQKSYVISMATVAATVVRTIMVVLLTSMKFSVVWLQVFLVLSVFLRSAILWFYTKRYYGYVNYNTQPDGIAIKDRWNVLYLQLLGSVQNAAPVVIATLFASLSQVSVYSIYSMVVVGVGGMLGIFSAGLDASFGDVIARRQRKILQNNSQEFEQGYYILITIFFMTTLLTIVPFVSIYTSGVNDVNYTLPLLGLLVVLNGFMYHIKVPQGMLVISAGMYRQTRWQTTAQALIALIGAVVLVQFWGLAGILMGLILSNLYRAIDLLFFVPKHITRLSYKRSLRRMLVALFNFAVAALCLVYVNFTLTSLIELAVYGFVILMLSSVLVILTNLAVDYKNMYHIYLRVRGLGLRRFGSI